MVVYAALGLALACEVPAPKERHGGPGQVAAYRAELFAHHALVKQDFASAYEMLPDREGVLVFLVGDGPTESYYKVAMIGAPDNGYVVCGLLCSDEPFPPHASRERHSLTESAA